MTWESPRSHSPASTAQAALEQSASHIARAAAPAIEAAPVDAVALSTEVVALLAARQNLAVNLKVLHMADQIERDALDILA